MAPRRSRIPSWASSILDAVSSLKLTIAMLAVLMVLVVAGTLHQVRLGIYLAQQKYFNAWLVWGRLPGLPWELPVFPGGFSAGGLLLVNLVAAHVRRFQFVWRKGGIHLIHAGLILLLIGQFFTAIVAEESQLVFEEGETVNYSQSLRDFELAVVDVTDSAFDRVHSVPRELFARAGTYPVPGTPLEFETVGYYPNSELFDRGPEHSAPLLADRGLGPSVHVEARPVDHSPDGGNQPTAFVEVRAGGQRLGRWVVSAGITRVQTLEHAGRRYELSLRRKRIYYPYSLTLLDFTHDRYPGTDIPKNFSSDVRLLNLATGEDRKVLIYMNNPLRYDGKAFFQASFGKDDTMSVLQVVENPGWTIPYIACVLVSIGLLWQFGMGLNGFLKRRRSA